MLLPLHDDNPLRRIRFGYFTVAFIAACVLVFGYQLSLPDREASRFVFSYGAIPSVVFGYQALPAEIAQVPANVTLVTSMFLHGGLMHLVGNMLFLWVLGDNVEDALGHARFVAFYLASGIVAALSHAVAEPGSMAACESAAAIPERR